VIAWVTTHFDEAPPLLNLFDPAIATRGALVKQLRERGEDVRMLWVPISLIAFGLTAVGAAVSIGRGRRPERVAAWSILRPRRYDARLSTAMLEATRGDGSRPAEYLEVSA
jgi:hypothetical protein